jgi:hypothetical protein
VFAAILILAGAGWASAAILIRVGPGGTTRPDAILRVPITVSGAGGARGLRFDVLFPESVLHEPDDTSTACEIPDGVPGSVLWAFVDVPGDPPGTRRLRMTFVGSGTETYAGGTLATCSFSVASDAASGSYGLPGAGASAASLDGTAMGATVAGSGFTVCRGCCP